MARGKKTAKQETTGQSKGREGFLSKWDKQLVDKDKEEALNEATAPISFGSIAIDKKTGGGARKGYASELYGPPYGGKTTLALSMARGVLDTEGSVLWIDLEGALDIGQREVQTATHTQEKNRNWLRTNGVDPFNERFVIAAPETGEMMYRMIFDAVVSDDPFDLIVVDSVAAVVTEAENAGEIGQASYGGAAKLHSQSLRVICKQLKKRKKTHLCFINQIRDVIGQTYSGKKSTGGNALEHYVRQRARIFRIQKAHPVGAGSDELVTKVSFKLEKSAFSPEGEAVFQISSKRGVDRLYELLEYVETRGYVGKSGSWYYFYTHAVDFTELRKKDQHTAPEAGYLDRVQGEGQAKAWMDEHGWFDLYYKEALTTITPVTGESDEAEDGFNEQGA